MHTMNCVIKISTAASKGVAEYRNSCLRGPLHITVASGQKKARAIERNNWNLFKQMKIATTLQNLASG
ncbi:MAG: hypothetical protein K0S63_8 [Gammaproteobacteria bacterium]|jgi:hypothetical protein|nr:hypothetical protein [Gammaproteobacteria bacterium]